MFDIIILFIENKYQGVNTEEANIERHYPIVNRRPECFFDSGCRFAWDRPDCCKGPFARYVKIQGLCCSW